MGGTAAWGHSLAGQRPQYPFAPGLGKRETKHSESDEGTALASSLFCILLLSGIQHSSLWEPYSSEDSGTCWATRWDSVLWKGMDGSYESVHHQWTSLRTLLLHWGPWRPVTPAVSARTQPGLAPRAAGYPECVCSLSFDSVLAGQPLQEEERFANSRKSRPMGCFLLLCTNFRLLNL